MGKIVPPAVDTLDIDITAHYRHDLVRNSKIKICKVTFSYAQSQSEYQTLDAKASHVLMFVRFPYRHTPSGTLDGVPVESSIGEFIHSSTKVKIVSK